VERIRHAFLEVAMRRALPCLPILIAAVGLTACAPEGPTAFVTYNLFIDENCEATADSETKFLPHGLYDISPGGNGNGDNCEKAYDLWLLVNSFLRPNADSTLGRAEPNILQLHSAQVRLMDLSRRTILFDRVNPPLPNPFQVTTNIALEPTSGDDPSKGIAVVEAIPTIYASQLNAFDGQQIFAEVQLFGTTTGDVDIDFKPFVYPIDICDGCLTRCLSSYPDDVKLEEIYGDSCPDNAGADGRLCIDRGC
jgi:hypothetical protein